MPEGDVVWLAARRLSNALAGDRLVRGELRVPRHATADLAGYRVEEVVARGKHLLTRLAGERTLTLHTHFAMDGAWRLYAHGRRWTGGPSWQIRALLETASWSAVGYRLPVVELLRREDEAAILGHLGPDVLGEDWDPAAAVAHLAADPTREIGQALLDQRNLAGLGNLYRTEACFLRGVHPFAPAGTVADLPALVECGRRLMLANRGQFRQSTTGRTFRGAQHWVFERAGAPCRRCGTTVRTARQGPPPRDRVTYWCPACQPWAGPGPEPA